MTYRQKKQKMQCSDMLKYFLQVFKVEDFSKEVRCYLWIKQSHPPKVQSKRMIVLSCNVCLAIRYGRKENARTCIAGRLGQVHLTNSAFMIRKENNNRISCFTRIMHFWMLIRSWDCIAQSIKHLINWRFERLTAK